MHRFDGGHLVGIRCFSWWWCGADVGDPEWYILSHHYEDHDHNWKERCNPQHPQLCATLPLLLRRCFQKKRQEHRTLERSQDWHDPQEHGSHIALALTHKDSMAESMSMGLSCLLPQCCLQPPKQYPKEVRASRAIGVAFRRRRMAAPLDWALQPKQMSPCSEPENNGKIVHTGVRAMTCAPVVLRVLFTCLTDI